jgi:hypothetical protein
MFPMFESEIVVPVMSDMDNFPLMAASRRRLSSTATSRIDRDATFLIQGTTKLGFRNARYTRSAYPLLLRYYDSLDRRDPRSLHQSSHLRLGNPIERAIMP